MKKLLCAALAALAACACEKLEPLDPQMVEVEVRAFGKGTKSAVSVQETGISDMNIYAYCGGVLHGSVYSEGSSARITLDRSRDYTLYVLANVGEVSVPYEETELGDVSFAWELGPDGTLPMCLREGCGVNLSDGVRSLDLPLTRLVSKYSLSIEPLLEHCDVQFNSVRMCQVASSISPFSGASLAERTADGDYASPEDLVRLNAGETVDFYVPENCQGVLLPGNADPWQKNPDSIPEKAELCTYMEISGDWTTSGAEADLKLRLYLGSDNVTDFNVVRNTNVQVGLTLSDDGTLRSSWKSSLEGLSDSRTLKFSPSFQYVYQEDGWTELPLQVIPPDMTYYAHITNEQIDGSLEIKTGGGKVYARSVFEGITLPGATVKVESWDGKQSSEMTLCLSYRPVEFTSYTAHIPQCTGEYGHITFDEVEGKEVIVELSCATWNLDSGSLSGWQKQYDQTSGDMFYLNPSSRTLYIHRQDAKGGSAEVKVRCFKSEKTFSLGASYKPVLKVNDGFITEAGCYGVTSSGAYYDSIITASLTYGDGTDLSMKHFCMPDELMIYNGFSSYAEAYSSFDSLYGALTFSSDAGSKAYFVPAYAAMDERFEYFESTGILQQVRALGRDELDEGTQYKMTFTLGDSSLSAVAALQCVKAFPGQGHLGDVYNYQVAPGDLRNLTSAIPFPGKGPSENLVSWSVVHSTSDLTATPQAAFTAGSSDDYSAAATVSKNCLTFSAMSTSVFPSCGHLALKGTVTNPYTNRTFTGYYTLDLVLYVSVGCQFDYIYPSSPAKIGISYVPFCEYSTRSLASQWNGHIPNFVQVRSLYNTCVYDLAVPSSANDNAWYDTSADYAPKAMVQDAMPNLGSHADLFKFEFAQFFNSGTELVCNRAGFGNYPSTEMQAYSDGRMGYYHFVRQYDVANIPAVSYNNGLDNYLVEAAYGSLSKY